MAEGSRQQIRLAAGDALIVIDVQNDFLAGGKLPVNGGGEVVVAIDRYVSRFAREHLPVFATRSWHPPDHRSFQTQGGRWPVHCLAGSRGAQYPSTLNLPPWTVVISKDMTPQMETYSGFGGTDLEQRLRLSNLHRLFIGGLTTDYCVLNTVKDALKRGFRVFLLCDAIRALNVKPDDGSKAEAEMIRLGAVPIQFQNLAEASTTPGSARCVGGHCDPGTDQDCDHAAATS